jgi:hypothetical protein
MSVRLRRGGGAILLCCVMAAPAFAQSASALADAQRMFYNGRYTETLAATAGKCTSDPGGLAACELRTSALLFQIRRELETTQETSKKDFKKCAPCQGLFASFVAETRGAQAIAHAALAAMPDDTETLFLLGKIDLNYVWLQLGILGRKTGWDEYWEGRHSLDKVLKRDPSHVRAQVARGWIDYIVDTRMPLGTRWLLGGGNKKKGLATVREAAKNDDDLFAWAEAAFALWDMDIREGKTENAVATAMLLSEKFPENPELRKFLDKQRNATR